MKIQDILREFDPNQVNVGQDVKSDFQKGSQAVKKILDPKQWFSGSSSADNARVKTKQLANVEVRDALNAAAAGKLYQSDIGALKQIINNLKNGTFKAANSKSIITSLELAINGSGLSKEQVAEIQAFAKSF